MLDAYCPHLGAHLGHGGTVVGSDIACPFHGWRFGTDGTCSSMPYGKRIPKNAHARSWSLLEQNGVILAWHDPAGAEPDWQMKCFDDRNWTPDVTRRWRIAGHTQEVTENTVDLAHFRFIHGTHSMRALGPPKIDGPYFEVAVESDPEAVEHDLRLDDPTVIEGSGFCFGPGLTAANMVPRGSGLVAMQRLYVTPIDEERVELLGVVNVRQARDGRADKRAPRGSRTRGLPSVGEGRAHLGAQALPGQARTQRNRERHPRFPALVLPVLHLIGESGPLNFTGSRCDPPPPFPPSVPDVFRPG